MYGNDQMGLEQSIYDLKFLCSFEHFFLHFLDLPCIMMQKRFDMLPLALWQSPTMVLSFAYHYNWTRLYSHFVHFFLIDREFLLISLMVGICCSLLRWECLKSDH